MQIQLRQIEIEQALKQYITKQGINLSNQSVDISFTAGRKGGGLLADITIKDLPFFPSLEEEAPAVIKPVLSVVHAPEPEPLPQIAVDVPPVEPEPAAPAPKVSTSSLFA